MFEHSQQVLDRLRNVVEEIAQEDFGPNPSAHRAARRILIDACQSWLDRKTPGLPGPHLERILAEDPRLREGTAEYAMVGPILAGLLLDIAWSLPSAASAG